MKEMKTFGVLYILDGLDHEQYRVIAKTTSVSAFIKLIGATSTLRKFVCETHNETELAVCKDNPGVLFYGDTYRCRKVDDYKRYEVKGKA